MCPVHKDIVIMKHRTNTCTCLVLFYFKSIINPVCMSTAFKLKRSLIKVLDKMITIFKMNAYIG